jgi:beta-lactam-binding protein with PASTA domain
MKKRSICLWGCLAGCLLLLFYPYPAISQNNRSLLVPLLINQSWQQAVLILENLGLQAKRVPEDCTESWQLNMVVGQYPAAGEITAPGATIRLLTCRPTLPDKSRQTPYLLGLDLSQAKTLAQKNNLKLRVIYDRQCLDPLLRGRISQQTPVPGASLRRGAVVWVKICVYTP